MRIRAYLDRCDTDRIGGWAIDVDQPDKPVQLDILHAGRVIGHLFADKPRPDLVEAGLTNAHNGFSVRYADLRTDVGPHRLIVKVHGSEIYLSASEPDQSQIFDFEPVTKKILTSIRRRRPLCVLHIGFEKTGSTSIQRFLRLYKEQLATHGYAVPLSLADPRENYDTLNHISVTGLACRITRFPADFKPIFGLDDKDSVLRYRSARLQDFAEEVRSFPPSATVILSNEHCQSRLTSLDEIARLKSILSAFFERIVIVAFIRPQYEVAGGLYDSALRSGLYGMDKIPRYDDPSRNDYALVHKDYFDFFKTLNNWSSVFGREALRVRRYDGNRTSHGVVGAFLEELGITDIKVNNLQRENKGFSDASRALLEVINRSVSERNIPLQASFRDWLFPLLTRGDGAKQALAFDTATQGFQRLFEGLNDEIKQVWFPEREALFEPFRQNLPSEGEAIQEFSVVDALVDLILVSGPR